MSKKDLFNKMANEILANPLTSSISSLSPKSKLGDILFDSFVEKLLTKYEDLRGVEGKLVTYFNKGSRNILSIEKQSTAIKITINAKKGTLKDTQDLLRDVSQIGHWGNGDYQIKLKDQIYFVDVLDLIKQIY